jgi:hypothetical protein
MAPSQLSRSDSDGRSFEIPDLMISQAWAEFHELGFAVELDHACRGRDYEEVLSFSRGGHRLWAIWRSERGVVVWPDRGLQRRFDSVPEALEAIGVVLVVAAA